MIQLYAPSNTNFDANGDVVLEPTSCLFDTKNQELSLEHPIDELGKWKYIQDGSVIKAPCDNGIQKFRLFKKTKTDKGISIKGIPIFMSDAKAIWIHDTRAVNLTCQEALNRIVAGTKFNASSDISDINTAYFVGMNLLNAICGDDDNTIKSRWGGEIMYDNETVIVNKQLGSDHGVEVRYGKNILVDGLTEETSQDAVCTRIIPQAYNGHQLPNGETVDSPLINKYPIVMNPQIIEYSHIKLKEDAQGNEDSSSIVCDTLEELYDELRKAAALEFSKNDIDKPKVNLKINMVLLTNSVEYQNHYSQLEEIHRGDTVSCIHDTLDINTKARVINLVWDCILNRPDSVEIGAEFVNYVAKTSNIISSAAQVIDTGTKTLIAEKVNGVINMLNTQMKAQKNTAQRQDVRAILFEDTDPESEMFGALCLGTQGLQLAKKRTADNSDWEWGTAINYQSVIADYIITGILSDKTGNFYLNLDTGELVMNDGTFKGKLDTYDDVNVGRRLFINTVENEGYSHIIFGRPDNSYPSLIPDAAGIIGFEYGNVKYIQICTNSRDISTGIELSQVNDDPAIMDLRNLSAITINGKTGLTGTYTVNNSITTEKGFVVGVD